MAEFEKTQLFEIYSELVSALWILNFSLLIGYQNPRLIGRIFYQIFCESKQLADFPFLRSVLQKTNRLEFFHLT